MFADRKKVALRLRYLERVPLGTPYPEVVERVRAMTRSAELAGQCQLVVDATGVGRPVVELLQRRGSGMRDHAGDDYGRGHGEHGARILPGAEAGPDCGAAGAAAERGSCRSRRGYEQGPALVKEMAEMQVKITAEGNEQYGAWREGEHDDLVFAVALACWGVKKLYPGVVSEEQGNRRLPGI